jgi:hypothetical protein
MCGISTVCQVGQSGFGRIVLFSDFCIANNHKTMHQTKQHETMQIW